MSSFIPPLELETIIIGVLSGSTDIFTALAIFFIAGLGGYFRMNGITLFMLGFLGMIMFSEWLSPSILMLVMALTGLLLGFWISKIVKN